MHAVKACHVHKVIVEQCRCPAPNKTTIYIPCDVRCPKYSEGRNGDSSGD